MTTQNRCAIMVHLFCYFGKIMSIDVEEHTEESVDIKVPHLWRVIFHNDDKTTMEFVIFLLLEVFHKTMQEATAITLEVHTENAAVVGVYTHEVAENKMNVCVTTARKEGFPLNISIEEEE